MSICYGALGGRGWVKCGCLPTRMTEQSDRFVGRGNSGIHHLSWIRVCCCIARLGSVCEWDPWITLELIVPPCANGNVRMDETTSTSESLIRLIQLSAVHYLIPEGSSHGHHPQHRRAGEPLFDPTREFSCSEFPSAYPPWPFGLLCSRSSSISTSFVALAVAPLPTALLDSWFGVDRRGGRARTLLTT